MKVSKESFALFVYPFKFDADDYDARVSAIKKSTWSDANPNLRIWLDDKFPEQELLPHVATYLNAEEDGKSTAHLWKMDSNVLRSAEGLGVNCDWILELPGEGRDVSFEIEGFQLALFRFGIGFLTVRVRPADSETTSWLDCLHYFRFFEGSRARTIRGQRRTGKDRVEPFFPKMARDECSETDRGAGTGKFGQIVRAALMSGNATQDRWWQDAYVGGQLLPFVNLYVDDCPSDHTPELIHRVRNFFHSRQEVCLSDFDRREDHPSLLPYAGRQWFLLSRDGGAFLACDAPDSPFFRETMPDHVSQHYFLIFQLVLHQHFVLVGLSGNVAEQWLSLPGSDNAGHEAKRRAAFEKNLETLLNFNARGLFAQTCHREHHHRYYVALQEFFAIDRLYAEIREEVREMHDYLTMRRAESVQRRLRALELIAVLIGVPGVVFTFLGINIAGFTTPGEGLSWWTALCLGAGTAMGACGVLLLVLSRWASGIEKLFSSED